MEGVTILKVIPACPMIYFFGFIFLGAGIGFFATFIKMLHDGLDFFWFPMLLGGVLIFSSMALFSEPDGRVDSYKVTISEEVSMADFYRNYEVIDQDGLIFTIRERE